MSANIEKNLIPVNSPFIDSFTLKLKLEDCTVLNEKLTSHTLIYYESIDEVDDELHPPKPLIFEHNGIKVRFSRASIPETDFHTKEKYNVEYVIVTVTSKLLKEKYFQGISAKTINIIYKELIAFKVVDFSVETFLKAKVSDIDIAINRYIDSADFQAVCRSLMTQADERAKHMKFFNDDEQIGLMYNKREWAKPSLPFCKLYYKEYELLTRSETFFNEYLTKFADSIKNLSRIECTIKNYKHRLRLFRKGVFSNNFSTLDELLTVPQSELYEFCCFSIGTYVTKQSRLTNPNLSPSHFLMFELMQNCRDLGLDSLLEIAERFTSDNEKSEAVARTRIRKTIEMLYLHIEDGERIQTEKELQNTQVNNYLKYLKVQQAIMKKENA